MRNKLLTKIAAISLGLAMAVGVSVGVANNRNTKPVYAEDTTVSYAATSGTVFGGTIDSVNGTSTGTVHLTDTSNTVSYDLVGVCTLKSLKSGKNDYRAFSSPYAQIGSGNANVRLDLTASDIPGTITSVDIFAYGSNHTMTVKVNGTSYYSETLGSSAPANAIHVAPNASGELAISFVATSPKALYFRSISVVYSSGSGDPTPTVTGVEVTGDMTTTSYTTVQSWSNTGLTATATMSDASAYDGQFSWGYSPATPAAAVIANDGNEVTGLSVTATATAGGQSGSKVTSGISVNYATVPQLAAATPASGTLENVIATGIVSQVDSYNSTYHSITYWISSDGTTSNQYKVYGGKGLDNANFNSVNDLRVNDIVVIYGNAKTFNSEKEFDSNNYLLKFERPASSEPSIVISDANVTATVGEADVQLHETHENVPDGGSVKWVSDTPSVATIGETTGLLHAVAPGTSEITAKIVDSGDNMVASNSITVTIYRNVFEDGDTFIIKAERESTTYYMTGVSSNLGTVSTTRSNAMVFTAVETEQAGKFQFKNGSDYLSYSGSDNKIYTIADSSDDTTIWTALNDGTDTVIESNKVSGRVIKFNYNNGSPRFACYTISSTMLLVEIEKVVAPEVDSVTVAGDASADANDALSITKDFTYEVTYVDDNNQGNSAVTVSVLNSNSTTDGASVTSAPSGGEFSVTFTASDTYTITVTSIEDDTKSDSTTIIISNIHIPVLVDYNLYTNDSLVEGDYLITYNNLALKATVNGNYVQYDEVTPVSSTVSTENNSIVWHIAPSGNYYTIYNALENKYLASTGSKNQAQLLADGTDDKALWSFTTSNDKFEFVNKKNTANGVNANLRENGAYGYACYSTSTGGSLTIYKKSAKNIVEELSTQTKLSYRYTSDGLGGFEYSDISIRFGGLVGKEVWDELDTNEHLISGFGVMITSVDSYVIKDHANEAVLAENTPDIDTQVVNHFMSKAEMATPVEQGDNYFWNLFFSIDATDIADVFVAAAYIKVGDEYVFMKQEKYSVETLAADYLTRRNYEIDVAGGSLYNLAEPALA